MIFPSLIKPNKRLQKNGIMRRELAFVEIAEIATRAGTCARRNRKGCAA